MIRVGTCNFTTLAMAEKYYACYGLTKADVGMKLAANEIKIGRPEITPAFQSLSVDMDGRYHITEKEEPGRLDEK